MLVYVDDLVITGSDNQFIGHVVNTLGARFSLKDMGLLHYFLGVEVIPTTAGLFLSQHKYVRDILETQNMVSAKEISTPLSTTQSLHLLDGITSTDNTEYRRIIGNLQYLSLTRPNICFAINKLSQFMHKPTVTHWVATKRLLCYLKQTIFHGIHIRKAAAPCLTTYSDVDWAGNINDRTSTSAYITFLGCNPISWS